MSEQKYPEPKPGSYWLNTRQNRVYQVLGMVAPCDGEEIWQVAYRSECMPVDRYRYRTLEEWYGNNREGNPRFVQLDKVLGQEIEPSAYKILELQARCGKAEFDLAVKTKENEELKTAIASLTAENKRLEDALSNVESDLEDLKYEAMERANM